MKDRFIGIWKIDPEDYRAIEAYGNVTIEFNSTGRLRYIIHTEEKEQIMFMTYEVDGDRLITDQPSAPRIETSRFEFVSDDKLKLFFDGFESTYIRLAGKKVSPWKKWLGRFKSKDA